MEKQCRSCKKMKVIDNFYKAHKGSEKRHNECKECTGERRKREYQRKKQRNLCSKCGKGIVPNSKYCRNCFLDSMRNKPKYCIDCGTLISKKAQRCIDCNNIAHSHRMGNEIGHKTINKQGYVFVKIAHREDYKNYQPEHRLVMEKAIGRKLEKGEHVHHIDANKQNNDISNLALLTAEEHGIFNRVIKACNTKGNNAFAEVVVKSIVSRFPELLVNLQPLRLDR